MKQHVKIIKDYNTEGIVNILNNMIRNGDTIVQLLEVKNEWIIIYASNENEIL